MRDKINAIQIFVIVFVSRLPFIWNSPGIDHDNWIVLLTGKEIAESGVYRVSRLPGYPISEYLAALFGNSSMYILNLVSVFLTSFSCVILFKILSHFKVKNGILAAISFGFVQSVFIASTSNMEYMWSVFFLLFGLWLLLKGKLIYAAVSIGLMVATRFSNIIFLIPILYFLFEVIELKNLKKYLLFYATVGIVFAVCFSPVFLTYSVDVFPKVGGEYVDFKSMMSLSTLYIYGLLGIVGLLIAICYLLFNAKKSYQNFQKNKKFIVFSLLMILVTSLVFVKFPYESYYNLPSVPFVIIVLAFLIESVLIKRLVFLLLIFSPFLFYVSSNRIDLKGSIFVNEKMENDLLAYNELIYKTFSQKIGKKKVLVTGGFHYNYLYSYPTVDRAIVIDQRPDEQAIKNYRSEGYDIYYPVSVKDEIYYFYQYDISKYGKEIGYFFNYER